LAFPSMAAALSFVCCGYDLLPVTKGFLMGAS